MSDGNTIGLAYLNVINNKDQLRLRRLLLDAGLKEEKGGELDFTDIKKDDIISLLKSDLFIKLFRMKLKEALDKGGFTYIYDEETKDFYDISHCGKKCEISTMSIVMCDTIECPECGKRLTRKRALMDECFLN